MITLIRAYSCIKHLQKVGTFVANVYMDTYYI